MRVFLVLHKGRTMMPSFQSRMLQHARMSESKSHLSI